MAPAVPNPETIPSRSGTPGSANLKLGGSAGDTAIATKRPPRREAPYTSETIIGQPGSLSTYLPTALSEPFGRPDSVLDAGRVGDLDVRAASIRGYRHRYSADSLSTTREDEYCLRLSQDAGWLVAVVADGVSNSSLQSHKAAEIAAKMGARIIAAELSEGKHPLEIDWKDNIHNKLSSAIIRSAAKESERTLPTDGRINAKLLLEAAEMMATTAVTAIIGTRASDSAVPLYVVDLAGDSSILLLRDMKWALIAGGKTSSADVVDSTVYALPLFSPEAPKVVSETLRSGEALFLMSDGVGDPLGSGDGEVGRLLAGRWSNVPEKWSFARDIDFHRETFDDDRTVVGVWLR
ncbi:protein phosphatase 2C domain-containing protein [Pseudarthrobacter sp. NPDC080039]|uniref:PP2C family serine/threonine-protein phosphatase n=1 Tax=unclassified Pseudarthrobacter TaxID=2647000 RepID=UPI00344B08F3